MRAGLFAGVTAFDIALGVVGTTLIQWTALIALGQSSPSQPAANARVVGVSVPVQLVAALPELQPESGRLKLGGGGTGAAQGVPRSNLKPGARTPAAPRAPEVPGVSFESKTPEGVAEPVATSPWLPDVTPRETSSQDGAFDGVPGEGEPGSGEGTGYGNAPPGDGFPEGSPDGTITDPLVAHAIRLYRERVRAWLASRFRVAGSGLPKAEFLRLRVRATVFVDDGRRVVGFEMQPSGNRAFDQAARSALTAVDGLELPPPPLRYPGPVQHQVFVTFVCKEDTCD